LFVKLVVLSAFTIFAMVWRRRHIIDDGARLGATLAMYFFWTIGGWRWLVAPGVLLASYVRVMPLRPQEMPRHDLVAVICVGSAGLVWCVAEAFLPDPRWRSLFTLGIATHQAIIAMDRYSQARPQWRRAAWTFAGIAQAVLTQGLAFWLVDHGATIALSGLAGGAACVIAATTAFVLFDQKFQIPDDLNARWWRQGTTAIIASIAGLYLMVL
jgi:phytol kinase